MVQRSGRLLSPLSGSVGWLASPDPDDVHDTTWESAWIDLGGEG